MITITRTETYNLLDSWLRNWEKLLEKSADILLERSFLNIVQAALVEIEGKFKKKEQIERSSTGWGRVLLSLLEEEFDNKSPIIDILRVDYPSEINSLKKLLKQGKFDIPQIYPLLKTIEDGPSVNIVFQVLSEEILKDTDANFDYFVTVSELVLRKALLRYSISTLKEKLQISLARHCSKIVLERRSHEIAGDKKIVAHIEQEWMSFIQNEVITGNITEKRNSEATNLIDIFESYPWQRKVRTFLKNIELLIADKLKLLQSENRLSGISSLSTSEFCLEIGVATARDYSNFYLCQLFESSVSKASKDERSSLKTIGEAIGTFLITNFRFNDNRAYTHEHRPNIVDGCCTDAFIRTVNSKAPEKFLSLISDTELLPVTSQVGKGIIELLKADETLGHVDWKALKDEDIDNICTNWSSNLIVQQELAKLLAPLNGLLDQKFYGAMNQQEFISFAAWAEDQSHYWRKWATSFSSFASWDRNIFHYLPWGSLEETILKQVLIRVSKDFDPQPDNWLTVFVIKYLKPPTLPKTIAEVTFYDPTRWNYGGKRWLSKGKADETTWAKVIVTASTYLEAERTAWLYLNDVLNCVAFSLSANKMQGGFKPVIDPSIYVHRLADDSWSVGQSLIRNDRPITQSFGKIEKFASLFDSLLDASRNLNLSMLQSKLLKALHWYAKGRWEQDPAQTFLFYWIGLEHLFDEERADVLLDLIASLHINWRDVIGPGGYFLTRHEADVIKQLENDSDISTILAGCPEFEDWDKDIRVFLDYENVKKLIELLPETKPQIKEYARSYADYLGRFSNNRDAILKDMESMRKVFRFRLLLLKHLRNNIVHRALPYTSNVALYTEKLEDIFEEAIVKLGNEAIKEIPECSSIKDIINKYQEIWF